MAAVTQETLDFVNGEIRASLSAAPRAQAVSLPVEQDFCNIWPSAKPVIQILVGLPLPPPIIAALTALMKVGDMLYGLCGSH